jgi:hypothetical protein
LILDDSGKQCAEADDGHSERCSRAVEVSYSKLRLHRMGYFRRLLASSEEMSDSIRPLLRLYREHIDRFIRLDTAMRRSLERDPLPFNPAAAPRCSGSSSARWRRRGPAA